MRCRSCGARDLVRVLDLGVQPAAASFPTPAEAGSLERWPLVVAVCDTCWLVQLVDPVPDEPPPDALRSTVSSTMAAHAERFVDEVLASAVGGAPRIMELASHGGHLASRFMARGVRTLVVDRSEQLVDSARAQGIDALWADLDRSTVIDIRASHGPFDIIVDNYLLAHQRSLDPQLAAISALLADDGQAIIEFDHLLPTIHGVQFDAIRHGHFSYLSLTALLPALERHSLVPLRASQQPVYGGAVRLWIGHAGQRGTDPGLTALLSAEQRAGFASEAAYHAFANEVAGCRAALHAHLTGARAARRTVVGYGAPTRGATLLNACGIDAELLAYTVDISPAKHGRLMPGSAVPIAPPSRIFQDRPNEVLILTWDIADEVVRQLAGIREWGGTFVTPIPRPETR